MKKWLKERVLMLSTNNPMVRFGSLFVYKGIIFGHFPLLQILSFLFFSFILFYLSFQTESFPRGVVGRILKSGIWKKTFNPIRVGGPNPICVSEVRISCPLVTWFPFWLFYLPTRCASLQLTFILHADGKKCFLSLPGRYELGDPVVFYMTSKPFMFGNERRCWDEIWVVYCWA